MHSARHLRPGASDVVAALRRRQRAVFPITRRGADLGHAVPLHRQLPSRRAALAAWRAAEPVFLPGVLGDAPTRFQKPITATLAMFDRLRHGGTLLEEFERRIGADPNLRYVGSSEGGPDVREIERVFVDAEIDGTTLAKDLWAMLARLAIDAGDASLRIRFSSGADGLELWLTATDLTAGWVDQFAARAFPECAAILTCTALRQWLDLVLPEPHRLSERILYNNAPDGGAVFHHDAETSQLGVVFSQLEGRTAWLAIGKRRLCALLAKKGHCRNQAEAMAALDRADDPRLRRVLNRDADFTGELAARGALYVLEAGDSILLPSHSIDDVAWHSVIGLGERPSLAHSYGIFPRAADYPVAADPWLLVR